MRNDIGDWAVVFLGVAYITLSLLVIVVTGISKLFG